MIIAYGLLHHPVTRLSLGGFKQLPSHLRYRLISFTRGFCLQLNMSCSYEFWYFTEQQSMILLPFTYNLLRRNIDMIIDNSRTCLVVSVYSGK